VNPLETAQLAANPWDRKDTGSSSARIDCYAHEVLHVDDVFPREAAPAEKQPTLEERIENIIRKVLRMPAEDTSAT
jgi:hypothetical protein